jgi:hypothetical protein
MWHEDELMQCDEMERALKDATPLALIPRVWKCAGELMNKTKRSSTAKKRLSKIGRGL